MAIFVAFILGLIIGGLVTVFLYQPYGELPTDDEGFDGTDNA